MTSSITFSAEFGGLDAADAVLETFKSLQFASSEILLHGIPFPELAFILRVDGEITSYGFSGLKYLILDRKRDYLSLDIGITVDDRVDLTKAVNDALFDVPAFIQRSRITKIKRSRKQQIPEFDIATLTDALLLLSQRFESRQEKAE